MCLFSYLLHPRVVPGPGTAEGRRRASQRRRLALVPADPRALKEGRGSVAVNRGGEVGPTKRPTTEIQYVAVVQILG